LVTSGKPTKRVPSWAKYMRILYNFLLLVIGMMSTTGVYASHLPVWKGAYGNNVLTAEKFCDIILNHPDQLNCSQETACQAMADALNFYANHNGWVKENGDAAKFTGPKMLILLKQGDLFVNSTTNWKKGQVVLARVDSITGNLTTDFERNSRVNEPVILFNPNNLKGIDLSSGRHKLVLIASGICGNFAKVFDKKTATASTGEFVVTEPGEYKVNSGTGNDITIIFKPEINVKAEANAEANSESTLEDNDEVASVDEDDENKPFQHFDNVSNNKIETVYVDRVIVERGQTLEDNSIVRHKGRWLRYVAGTGFVVITGLAILRSLNGYQNYLQPYGGYNVIPARTFNTIQGNTWQTTSAGVIQGNAGGGNYTNGGYIQGSAHNDNW